MSTSGISSRFTIGGLATGIDTSALLEGLLAVERIPLNRLESQRSAIQTERGLVQDLNKIVLDIRNAALALDNQNTTLTGPATAEEFLSYAASSSAEDFVSASVSGDAAPGEYTVRVNTLASVGREISNAFADTTTPFGTAGDTFSIDFGGDAPIDVAIGAGGLALADLVSAINTSPENDGSVQASLLFDGASYRLIVAGTRTGAANDIAITTSLTAGANPFLDATLSTNATDASLEVLGVPVTRSTNQFSDAIQGVSLDLRRVHGPSDPTTTIAVARDDEAIADKLQELVDAVNALRDFSIGQSTTNETSKRGGPLNGSNVLRTTERVVFENLIYRDTNVDPKIFETLATIGVRSGEDGKLSIDRSVLEAKLDENPLAVRQLLAGDGTRDGIATQLARVLEPIVRIGDGMFAKRAESFDDRLEVLDLNIERLTARLALREETLIRQFSTLESSVARLQSQSSFLNGV